MQASPTYQDVVGEVETFLLERASRAEAAGVRRERILLDPGIGFGKSIRHNLLLIKSLRRFSSHGYPLVVGASRKRFLGLLTGEPEAADRLAGSLATAAWSVLQGAAVVRVHDVRPTCQTLRTLAAIGGAETYVDPATITPPLG